MTAVNVRFATDSVLLQKLFDAAESTAKGNLRDFSGRQVLVEGGGYEKIWLETQPMGGEMYAKRNMEAALNNQLLFMENQRTDGRMPGSILCENDRIIPQFNKFQGFCFPAPALNMYWLSGRDPAYLDLLYRSFRDFDAYLWRVRDSDGDGCLESWCVYDTGEDHALRYGDAPCWWEEETPPEGYQAVPIASMDFMGYSCSARDTLAEICLLSGRPEEASLWREKARSIVSKIRSYLWDDARGACFDRDRHGKTMPALIHNTLRLMYWGALDRDTAGRFVNEHLLNPEEFWTPMPLPSVAANDMLFRNIASNNWSGQPEGLTFQRAIRAMENYGYLKILTCLGRKLFEATGDECVFTQQFDPFTMKPSRVPVRAGPNGIEKLQNDYGPTILSVLEYISRLFGVHIEHNEVWFGILGGMPVEYSQEWGGREYAIRSNGRTAEAYLDGKLAFRAPCGIRAVTNLDGHVLGTAVIEPDDRLAPDIQCVEAVV